jgi:hypothetical protein
MFAPAVLLLAALAAVNGTPLQKRSHVLTIHNNCAQSVTPSLTNTGGPFVQLKALAKDQTTTTTVPENVRDPTLRRRHCSHSPLQWTSGRVFGQTGKCSKPDGAGW